MGRPAKNIKDQRFGSLVVVEGIGSQSGSHYMWRCLCDCGNERVVSGTKLRQGIVVSCGCLLRSRDTRHDRLLFPSSEVWKSIPDWPYEASSEGRVRRACSNAANTWAGKVKTPVYNKQSGYWKIQLSKANKARTLQLHACVCAAFYGPRPSPNHDARHLDGNKNNNKADNLAWGTRQENSDDKKRHGTFISGEVSTRAMLTNAEARQMREECETLRVASRKILPIGVLDYLSGKYGLAKSSVSSIIRGERYKDI